MPETLDTSQNPIPLKLSQSRQQPRLPTTDLDHLMTWQPILRLVLMLTGNMSVDMKEVSIERTPRQPGSSGSGGVCEDSESLDELSSDELEQNLQQQHELLTEIAALTRPNPYAQVSIPKTTHQ